MIAARATLERNTMHEKHLVANRETIAAFTNFDKNYVDYAAVRGQINTEDLGSICIWLAENGKPELRAKMARRLAPVLFGIFLRDQAKNDSMSSLVEDYDLLLHLFKRADALRQARAKQISKTKRNPPKKNR